MREELLKDGVEINPKEVVEGDTGGTRDANGKWVKGGAPHRVGNRPKLATLIETFDSIVPMERWKRIIDMAATLAEEKGDWHAREWLSGYRWGKPKVTLEVEGGVQVNNLQLQISKVWNPEALPAGEPKVEVIEAEVKEWEEVVDAD